MIPPLLKLSLKLRLLASLFDRVQVMNAQIAIKELQQY